MSQSAVPWGYRVLCALICREWNSIAPQLVNPHSPGQHPISLPSSLIPQILRSPVVSRSFITFWSSAPELSEGEPGSSAFRQLFVRIRLPQTSRATQSQPPSTPAVARGLPAHSPPCAVSGGAPCDGAAAKMAVPHPPLPRLPCSPRPPLVSPSLDDDAHPSRLLRAVAGPSNVGGARNTPASRSLPTILTDRSPPRVALQKPASALRTSPLASPPPAFELTTSASRPTAPRAPSF